MLVGPVFPPSIPPRALERGSQYEGAQAHPTTSSRAAPRTACPLQHRSIPLSSAPATSHSHILSQDGGFTIKYRPGGQEEEIRSDPREVRSFGGRPSVVNKADVYENSLMNSGRKRTGVCASCSANYLCVVYP